MDVVSQLLSSLRLTGGVITDAYFSGDFCVQAEFTPAKCAPFFPMPDALIAYHYMRRGSAIVSVKGAPPVAVGAGEIVFLPRNEPHLLSSKPGLPPARVEDITLVTAEGLHQISYGTEGPKTEIWCGFLGTAKDRSHPLLDALPSLMTLDVAQDQEAFVDASMRFLAQEQPGPATVARLAEVFVVQAIRHYLDNMPADSSGWLRGLADPAVSKALAIIHERYAEELDVEGLAREAGVSRTVLGERFASLLGEPPMRYCARWRMRMAANMLREGKQNSANIAYAVGFNSEAAFNRAFKREYGEPPATWRRRVGAEGQAGALPSTAVASTAADEIAYCISADGTRIGYAISGQGFPVVKAPNCVTHLKHDRSSPIYSHWLAELSRSNRLVRFDMRGFGMSEWRPEVFSLDAHVQDLAAVVEASGVEQFDLLGITHGAAVAIAYAARFPDRVRKLVLLNSFAAGWAVRGDAAERSWRKSLMDLNRNRWARDGVALGERFVSLYFPSGAAEIVEWHKQLFEELCTADSVERMLHWGSLIDVRRELSDVRTPTLVFHCVHDGNAPPEVGKEVADSVAGARFVELESANHVLLESELAWPVFVREMRIFLSGETMPPKPAAMAMAT